MILEKNIEIFSGPTSITQVNRKIEHYTINYNPEELLIKMKRTIRGYYTTIYMSKEDLK